MKTERLILFVTPAFKKYVTNEASREGISIVELVQRRVQRKANEEESALIGLTAALRAATRDAEQSVDVALVEVEANLAELRQRRKHATRS